ncbi:hypothetical protein DBV15_10912 [Temnothorax longispinosus]|uniref:Uncharacterized protein n=1 Tax=Temnothorax longispinosus TaxID=300112 RepID=A0A4S2KR44_9HYME|nr:hypothetical protein DBV15_10912 [Temnothorax longispinosus]
MRVFCLSAEVERKKRGTEEKRETAYGISHRHRARTLRVSLNDTLSASRAICRGMTTRVRAPPCRVVKELVTVALLLVQHEVYRVPRCVALRRVASHGHEGRICEAGGGRSERMNYEECEWLDQARLKRSAPLVASRQRQRASVRRSLPKSAALRGRQRKREIEAICDERDRENSRFDLACGAHECLSGAGRAGGCASCLLLPDVLLIRRDTQVRSWHEFMVNNSSSGCNMRNSDETHRAAAPSAIWTRYVTLIASGARNFASVKSKSVSREKEFKSILLGRETRDARDNLASVTLTYLTRETALGDALIIYRVVTRAMFLKKSERKREKESEREGEGEPRTFRMGRTTGPEVTFPTVKRESAARKPN